MAWPHDAAHRIAWQRAANNAHIAWSKVDGQREGAGDREDKKKEAISTSRSRPPDSQCLATNARSRNLFSACARD